MAPSLLRIVMDKDEILEPSDWDFYADGLFCEWYPRRPIVKNEIDIALKKLFGKDSHKPTKFKRWDFRKK